ncbi:MAG TPA: addiction module protein [Lacipirellulaceae bacterium]|jgi:putative addiction module component (TIGR02574 family)
MNLSADELMSAALALPDGDRVELVEAILASLQPDDRPPFDESWREVILRRSAELDSGKVAPIPWSDVKRRGREQAGG